MYSVSIDNVNDPIVLFGSIFERLLSCRHIEKEILDSN